MHFLKKFYIVKYILLIFFLSGCGLMPKPDWSKPAEPSGKERAKQNVKEGKGFNFGSKKKGGDFLFASSNPLWRASIETIDFMSFSTVDYAGGLIITDWYNDELSNEALKITITFLTNEVRVDALKIDVHKRKCEKTINCSKKKINTSLNNEIRDKILRKAALYEKNLKKIEIESAPEKKFPGDNEKNPK